MLVSAGMFVLKLQKNNENNWEWFYLYFDKGEKAVNNFIFYTFTRFVYGKSAAAIHFTYWPDLTISLLTFDPEKHLYLTGQVNIIITIILYCV